MAAELLNVPRLTIRHYKNKSLYDSYSSSRNDGDISIIGDSMSVYGISVIDDLVSKVNANIEINANKLKEIAESGISQFNGKIDDLKANTYTKVEADGKFQPKGKYVKEEYLQQLESAWSDELDKKAEKDDVYTKDEVNEKVGTIPKNVYTKYEADTRFARKGEAGVKGDRGERGPQGPPGPQGPKGDGAYIDTSDFVKQRYGRIMWSSYELWIA